jgi:7-cyano-7-deazaguanine synthase
MERNFRMAGLEQRAIVHFSGGQDSTLCLAWALTHFSEVETVGFAYGQRHAVELACRPLIRAAIAGFAWPGKLGQDHLVDLSALGQISDTALTRETEIRMDEAGLPTTFVPGRNVLFFTLAAALASRRGAGVLVGGMCETDYSGYPDCRDDTLKALQVTLNLGMAQRFRIETPLMWLTKAQSWAFAAALGGPALVDLIVEETHSCYLGERGLRHDWGYGCGTCPACDLRAKGFADYRAGS